MEAYNHFRSQGREWIHKRVHRIYLTLGFHCVERSKRLPARVKDSLETPNELNHTRSIDFMTDVLNNKRRFRVFKVIDDYNREVLHLEINCPITSSRVI